LNTGRGVDNNPAWMTKNDNTSAIRRTRFKQEEQDPSGRICVMAATILNHSQEHLRAMPLDVDNRLPGCQLRFGKKEANTISFLCHIDTCAAMSTGNLTLHKWVMTTYPHIVAEYTQYDDSNPFDPIRLSVALQDLAGCDALKSKLTVIVRYWTPYFDNMGNQQIISIGLGESISVNTIIGLPQLRSWKASVCFHTDTLASATLETEFPLIYEMTKVGVLVNANFDAADFVRPGPINPQIQLSNVADINSCLTDSSRYENEYSVESTETHRIVKPPKNK